MLTPKFELQQNEDYLFVCIEVPYGKISEVEISFEDYTFLFYSKPYYLRLNFPSKVVYSESPDIQYDVDKKSITVKVPKAEPGEKFEGLDLYTSLLNCKKTNRAQKPLVEVIGEADCQSDENFNLSIEQQPFEDYISSPTTLIGKNCGFANSYSFSVFNLKEETSEIFDVKDPEMKTAKECTEERFQAEEHKFDKDHCLADLYDDEEIQNLLTFQTEWQEVYFSLIDNWSESPEDKITFTAEEKDLLRALPNKEYLLDKYQVKTLLLGIVDIIFAYAYNFRTMQGENNIESAWTINKLSATLSWLETFSSLPEVTRSCIRRSLCYPLYRHFGLTMTVLDDVRQVLLLGKKYVLKCLLNIHKMFSQSDPRYILNDLYITDYCVWIQNKRCSSAMFIKLGIALERLLSTKSYEGLQLRDYEYYVYLAWLDHTEQEDSWQWHSSKVLVDLNPDEPENVCQKNSSDERNSSEHGNSDASDALDNEATHSCDDKSCSSCDTGDGCDNGSHPDKIDSCNVESCSDEASNSCDSPVKFLETEKYKKVNHGSIHKICELDSLCSEFNELNVELK